MQTGINVESHCVNCAQKKAFYNMSPVIYLELSKKTDLSEVVLWAQ